MDPNNTKLRTLLMIRQLYRQGIWLLLTLLACSSCQLQDDLFGKKTETTELGSLELSVLANAPVSMTTKADATQGAAVNTDDFEVMIKGEEQTDGSVFSRQYSKVKEMPTTIQLAVGNYTVTSNTPGELKKRMSAPYYAGDTELTITKDVTSNASVKCTMKNSRIQLQYSDDFKSTFQQWKVTLDDGSDTALYFTDQDSDEDIYWAFDEGVAQVRVNIQATTNDGNVVRDSRTFTKSMVTEGYGDVNSEDFTGGDALVLDFKPAAPSTPTTSQVTGINVSLFITFSEYKEQIQIPVSDKEIEQPSTPPSQPEGPSTPTTPEVAAPTISLPADFTYAISGNPAKPASADAVLNTPAGLKSALVKIETNNAAFTTTLQDAAFDQAGALLTGAELIGNQAMQNLFDSIGLKEADGTPKKTPVAGVTTYTFPIAAFFTFLDLFTGTHKFHLTLTDSNNQQVTKTLTVTITE